MSAPMPFTRWAELVVADVVELAAAVGVAEELTTQFVPVDHLPALVIVGETKKGKSSLVNALVGRPGLSPVAVDVATATYMLLEYGPDRATVVPLDGTPRTITLDELPAWVTVDGVERNPDAVPSPVRVQLEHELLRSIALVDTPGVGGLVGDHAETTLQAIKTYGSALLFVTDLTVPLTEPEVSFLRRIAASADVVDLIIVANMADKLDREQAAAATAALEHRIAEHLPEFDAAPVLAVSAQRAALAASGDLTPDERAIIDQLSGFDALARVIHERVVTRGREVVAARSLASADRLLTHVRALLDERTEPIESRAIEARMYALEDESRDMPFNVDTARQAFNTQLTQLRRTLRARLDTEFAELSAVAQRSAAEATDHETIGRVIDAQLRRLSDEVAEQTRSGIAAAARASFAGLVELESMGPDARVQLELAFEAALAEAAARIALRPPSEFQQSAMSIDAYVMTAMSVNSGIGIGNVVARTLGMASGLGPAGPLLGLATATLNWARAKRTMKINDTRSWVNGYLTAVRRDLSNLTEDRLDQASNLTNATVRKLVKARQDEIHREMRDLRKARNPGELKQAKDQAAQAGKMQTAIANKLRELRFLPPAATRGELPGT